MDCRRTGNPLAWLRRSGHNCGGERIGGRKAMRATRLLAAIAGLALTMQASGAGAQTRNTLDIYVVDVEGGNATLFVTPSGESLLIDTGNVGAPVRDAERIMAAAQDARITQID